METPRPTPISAAAHAPKARPDPRPMRFALSVGGIAAFSALTTAIVLPPRPAVNADYQQGQAVDPGAGSGQVQRPVRYVQLSPGQTAPPGATVIDAGAPTPVTVVVTITRPPQKAIVIKTTQSGKVVP